MKRAHLAYTHIQNKQADLEEDEEKRKDFLLLSVESFSNAIKVDINQPATWTQVRYETRTQYLLFAS
jgi:hypothetical protein